jgi:hypothetical protein
VFGHTSLKQSSLDLTRELQQKSTSAAKAIRPGTVTSLHSRLGSTLQVLLCIRLSELLRLFIFTSSAEVGVVLSSQTNQLAVLLQH